MTRILAIEGTGIRKEINECGDCPLSGDEMPGCEYAGSIVWWSPPPKKCPLPEKP